MLIHLPVGGNIGPENFIDTGNFSHCLQNMVEAVTPRSRGSASFTTKSLCRSDIQVFDSGIYTVVLARDAADIPSALDRVPADKRPAVNQALFDFYSTAYSGYAVALCCFNIAAETQAHPIMIWYPPKKVEGLYRLPAIDCHTGGVPNLSTAVKVDHWLFLGRDGMNGGIPVTYKERGMMPDAAARLLPSQVYWIRVKDTMQNGDFGVREMSGAHFSMLEYKRLPPPMHA